jgi:ATP-dependent DNA helicase RecQ
MPQKSPTDSKLDAALREVFGHDDFRDGQREVIEVLMAGRPSLAVFPTGSGKSLCYQLPAVMLDGLTLVISPLIALMKDQVEAMTKRGVAAARLDSSLSVAETDRIYEQMEAGELKLLYIAPERLNNEPFTRRLGMVPIALVAIDEAHCISEWGHNFRPDYLKLGGWVKSLGVKRVLALTATATESVAEDIRRHFEITEEDHIHTGFRRPNLHFRVTPCGASERKQKLAEILREMPDEASTIVYVTLQRTAEEVATWLAREGFSARAYHAGMPSEYRSEAQEDFMAGQVRIVVATIAFGMGIDKADIRAVVHYNLPKSLENYVQETGRAGRDGGDARCEILACGDDRIVLQNFVYGDTPSQRGLQSLLEHLLMQGESFDVSYYDLAATCDIRPLVIATALAQLELRGVLSAKGSFYGSFRYQFLQPVERVLAGHTEERQEFLQKLFDLAKFGRSWHTIDVASAAEALGEKKSRIAEALNHLGEIGDLRLQPSRPRYAYELDLENGFSRGELIKSLTDAFHQRENNEIERIETVVAFCESGECLTRQLLDYFGEELQDDCGTCGNCIDSTGGGGNGELPTDLVDDISAEQVAIMQEVAAEKNVPLRQPRQLARFLCGLSSPAATRARLSRHDHYGALEAVPFQTVLAQVETMLL